MDDCFSWVTTLQAGTRWDPSTKCLLLDPKRDEEDRNNSTNMEHITMEEFAKLSSGLVSGLKFTFDVPPDSGGGMPVLDTCCRMGVEERE